MTQNIENSIVTSKALAEISNILPEKVSRKQLSRLYQQGYEINQAIRSHHHVEIPIETWMRRLLTTLDTEPSQQLVKRAIRIVVSARAENAVAFPDSRLFMTGLARTHAKIAALSNVSSHELAVLILEKTRLKQYFDTVVTSARAGIRKPDPGIFRSATHELRVEPEEAVIVGDSEQHDIWGGYASGLHTVLVDRRKSGYDTIADHRFENLESSVPTLQSL